MLSERPRTRCFRKLGERQAKTKNSRLEEKFGEQNNHHEIQELFEDIAEIFHFETKTKTLQETQSNTITKAFERLKTLSLQIFKTIVKL